ncbi:MAG: site-specific DNA-methyltransferase [Bacillota bacterium]
MQDNEPNYLYLGDNLRIMREQIRDACADLVYLDPPFNSGSAYTAVLPAPGDGSRTEIEAFDDRWEWDAGSERTYGDLVSEGAGPLVNLVLSLRRLLGEGDLLAYLLMITARLVELRRILKPSGTLYLHCDPTASHYLKVILDVIFGRDGFLNEIIWKYEGPQSPSPVRFATRHDIIFRYGRDANMIDVSEEGLYLETPMSEEEARRKRYRQDERGRWYYDTPTGDYSERSLLRLEEADRIRRTRTGKRRVKHFLKQNKDGLVIRTKKMADVWDDIPSLGLAAASREKLGYPTQKPEALLERIIRADSRPGQVVFDPFCGCGTALVAAERLNRRWMGADVSHLAIALTRYRLAASFGSDLRPHCLKGVPDDLAGVMALARSDPAQFSLWALALLGARPVTAGTDGTGGLITVRDPGGGHPTRAVVRISTGSVTAGEVRELEQTVNGDGAEIGVIIAAKRPTGEAVRAAQSAGAPGAGSIGEEPRPRIQILTAEDLLRGERPRLPSAGCGEDRRPRQQRLF